MRRTNSFKIEWDNPEEARELALGCSTLWNKLNHKRRQSFFHEKGFDCSSDELYDDFKESLLLSEEAQLPHHERNFSIPSNSRGGSMSNRSQIPEIFDRRHSRERT